MQTKNCLNCEQLIIRLSRHKNNWQLIKYCSIKCSHAFNYFNYRKLRRQRTGFRSKNQSSSCLGCIKEFKPMNSIHKYCSSTCRLKHIYHKISLKSFKMNSKKRCLCCKNIFTYQRNNQKFCNRKCSEKYNEHLRSSRKNGRRKEIAKKLHLTVEEYNLLRKKCVICEWGYNINIHHVIPIRLGGINSIDNFLPLCFNCHKLIHSGYSLDEIKEIVKKYTTCSDCKTSVKILREQVEE